MKQILLLFLTLLSISSFAQTFYSENSVKVYWKNNGMEQIEGIYESISSYDDKEIPCTNGYGQTICYMTWRYYESKYKVALIKQNGEYK